MYVEFFRRGSHSPLELRIIAETTADRIALDQFASQSGDCYPSVEVTMRKDRGSTHSEISPVGPYALEFCSLPLALPAAAETPATAKKKPSISFVL